MKNEIGNYAKHAKYWDWAKLDHDRTPEDDYWYNYAKKYGNKVLIPMCAWGHTGAYMAQRGMNVTAFDITPEMIAEGKKHFGDIAGLQLFEGDITGFRFDITPVDFCYSMDFGHILSIEDIKKAFVCINNHLRDGGGLVIETTLPPTESQSYPVQTFMPENQLYPGLNIWKTSEGRIDAETARNYISQKFYAEDKNGNIESFDHSFYLQSYSREEWLNALNECGFEVVGEYSDREVKSWQSGDGLWIVEAVKSFNDKQKYMPAIDLYHMQTPIYRYENVEVYNDSIALEFPNDGRGPKYHFCIKADGEWVGWIDVKIYYSIRCRHDGQIGYWIDDEKLRNRGYMTKALLALKPFLKQSGFKRILIGTDIGNLPSRRVCEKIGAELIEIFDTPTWTQTYKQGQRKGCMYEWKIEDIQQPEVSVLKMRLQHVRINTETDKDYIFERHCRINYECDTPWTRKIPYDEYRTNWFANIGQQNGFLSALTESMKDERTIAEIIKTESGEIAAYFWVSFHGEDPGFIWADVQDIYIEETYRKSGIATYLMDYAEKSAKQSGAKVIRSGTGCENVKSQGLHQKMGYYQYRYEYEKILKD